MKKAYPITFWLFITLFILFLIANILLAYVGISSVMLFLVPFTILGAVLKLTMSALGTRPLARKTAWLLTSSIFVTILLIEAGLRIHGKYDSYNESAGGFFYISPYHKSIKYNNSWLYTRTPNIQKSASKPEYSYVIKTNSEGLRDIEHPHEKEDDEVRIIVLGGSFTEGFGVATISKSWIKVLERNLGKRNTNKKITVINGGVAGSDPFFGFMLLKKRLSDYHPNLVILELDKSDVDDVIIRGGMERFMPNDAVVYKPSPWYEPFYGMSYLCRIFMSRVLNYNWLFVKPEDYKGKQEVAMTQLFDCIIDFQEYTKANSIELMIVFHPMMEEIISKQTIMKPLFDNLKENTSINVVDLLPHLNKIAADNVNSYYWPIDRHHTELGYRVYAKGVEKGLYELGLIRQINTL